MAKRVPARAYIRWPDGEYRASEPSLIRTRRAPVLRSRTSIRALSKLAPLRLVNRTAFPVARKCGQTWLDSPFCSIGLCQRFRFTSRRRNALQSLAGDTAEDD